MKHPRLFLRFPVLLACLSPFYLPAVRITAGCCGGGGGAVRELMPSDGSGGGGDGSCAAGGPKVTVENTGEHAIQVSVGDATINVPAGQTVTKQLPPNQKFAAGQTFSVGLHNETGGTAATSDSANVHWTFPQKDKKGDCKKEEKVGSGKCETCGTDAKLKGGGDQASVDAKCGNAENNNQTPEGAPEDPQGSAPPCSNPGTLYDDGSGPKVSELTKSVSVNLGDGARNGWSAGTLISGSDPLDVSSYILQGADSTTHTCVLSGGEPASPWSASPMIIRRAYVSRSGLTVASKVDATHTEIHFYHRAAYTEDGATVVINTTGIRYPHRVTFLTKLAATTDAPYAAYTAGGMESTVSVQDETTGDQIGPSTTTVVRSNTGSVYALTGTPTPSPPPPREMMTETKEGFTTITSRHATTTTYTTGSVITRTVAFRDWPMRVSSTGVRSVGNVSVDHDETWRLFPWGEEVVSKAVYPDGKVAGYPAITQEFVWWDASMGTSSLVGSLKMVTEKYGTVGGSTWNTGSWAVTWTEPGTDGNSIQVTLKPWMNGAAMPDANASLGTLHDYTTAATDYTAEKTTSKGDGTWVATQNLIRGNVVSSSSDSSISRIIGDVTEIADGSTSFLTHTERESSGDHFLAPVTRYEPRAGQVEFSDSRNLIAKSSWFRRAMYPGIDPADPLQAVAGGDGDASWEVEWSSRREFPESTPSGPGDGGTYAEGDRVLKTCILTDRANGNTLVERTYLSTSDANSGDNFTDTTPGANILLKTKVWTYDTAGRPRTLSVDGVLREEWTYTDTVSSTTTTHTDEDGLQTIEVTDREGRPTQRTILANGTAGQNDVITTWTYSDRPDGKSGTFTKKTVTGAAWTRNTEEETDSLGRVVRTSDEAGIEYRYSYTMGTSGERVEITGLKLTNPPDPAVTYQTTLSETYYRDGQLKTRSGSSVVPESFGYLCAPYSKQTYRYLSTALGSNLYGYTTTNGLGRVTSAQYPVSGNSTTTTYFLETRSYDDSGRVKARKVPCATGNLYEVHSWERVAPLTPADPGAYAHNTALSTNTEYDSSDANRARTVSSYVKIAPYGGSTQLWWEMKANATGAPSGSSTGASSGNWNANGFSRQDALQEVAMTLNGTTAQVPLNEINDGGLRTITAENRNRATRTVIRRAWRHSSSLFRSVTSLNGLPTTYTAPELTSGITRHYSPLREPLEEADFGNYPYWPKVELEATTGRVIKSYLPCRTTAAPDATTQTASYTYYPSSVASAGLLATSTNTATGGAVSYTYNDLGQVTGLSGSGTYPQSYAYDGFGRMYQMDTWQTAGVAGSKASTVWAYAGLTSLVRSKTYPDAGLGNRVLNYAYNSAGQVSLRTAQRGLTTNYSYDPWARLRWMDYSDTTPDVEYAYNDSGRFSTVREGTLSGTTFSAIRTTTYAYRYDGMTTGETITDTAGATVSLGRGYDTLGRQSSLNQSWSQSPAGILTAPFLTYSYTAHQRLSGITATEGSSSISASLSRLAATESVSVSPYDLSFGMSSNTTRDIYGRVSGQSYSGSGPGTFGGYSTTLRWDRDRLAARGKSSAADRWEYRYNAKGEVSQAWKQFQSAVLSGTSPNTAGEVKSGVGSIYTYDDIGNRIRVDDIGRAVLTTASASIDTASASTSLRSTHYAAPAGGTPVAETNILNQYKTVANPQFFNVVGTRSAGAAIVVNGDPVDTTPSADSGYQQSGTGTYFRDEVPNTNPSGTSSPDLYEPVKVTSGGSSFTVDDPVQYVPLSSESPINYDLDGNLTADGRWTYTWDAADRLIRMECAAWNQPAFTGPPATPAGTVPAKLIEFGYDAFSRRIRKKVHTKAFGASSWSLASWEAYAYDGWNMIATYRLTTASAPAAYAGTAGGVVLSSVGNSANYVWGPDFGSRLDSRTGWQRAGGVGGLLMANYPSGGYYAYDIKVPYMDHMGNVIGVDYATAYPNGSGLTCGAAYIYDYDAFGKEVRSSTLIGGSADNFPFHFSTKFTDTESGFNYYGYRYYDAVKGRWLSRDPIGESGGANLYGIINNNFINNIDFCGLIVRYCEKDGQDAKKDGANTKNIADKMRKLDPRLDAMMKQLEGSNHVHNLCAEINKDLCKKMKMAGKTTSDTANNEEVKNEFNGKGAGTSVNSLNEGMSAGESDDGYARTPESNLAHELQHAYDSDMGIKPTSGVDKYNVPIQDLAESEARAVRTENIAREKQGIGLRTTYGGEPIKNPGSEFSPLSIKK